jgi:hypothetical protein
MYTSLTTSYDFYFDQPGGLMLPFPETRRPRPAEDERPSTLVYFHGTDSCLLDYPVASNSTGMVHGEQMHDLGGALQLAKTPNGELQLANHTGLTLHEAGVIRRNTSGERETAWVGTLEPDSRTRLAFGPYESPPPGGLLWEEQWRRSTLTSSNRFSSVVDLRRLVSLAQGQARAGQGKPGKDKTSQNEPDDGLRPGEMRLIAGLKQPVPGLTIKPAAPQSQYAGLVVAHLQYGFGPDPKPDKNIRQNPTEIRETPTYDGR